MRSSAGARRSPGCARLASTAPRGAAHCAAIYLQNGRQLLFIDSFQFVLYGLDEISKSLRPEDMELMEVDYPNPEQRQLLQTKGVYCYEFAKKLSDMTDTQQLPPREAFFSSLSGSTASPEEYERAKVVWRGLECEDLIQYCLHYLRSDTLILACFFNKFRSMIQKKYGLEINYFVSASSLSLCCMYNFTGA